jgi:hypothetical protein
MAGKGLPGGIILYSFVYSYNTHQPMTKSIVSTLLFMALFTPVLSAQTDSVVSKLSDYVVYKHLDTIPSFPGGDQARMNYLARNTEYPAKAREMGHEGTVYVGFVVETDGSLTDIRIITGGFPHTRFCSSGCSQRYAIVDPGKTGWQKRQIGIRFTDAFSIVQKPSQKRKGSGPPKEVI